MIDKINSYRDFDERINEELSCLESFTQPINALNQTFHTTKR